MDIQTRKLEFIQEFLKLENEDVIFQLENLLKARIPGNFSGFTTEELLTRLNQSESDFNLGNYKSAQELLEKYK